MRDSMLNGEYLERPAERRDEVIAVMSAAGLEVILDAGNVVGACQRWRQDGLDRVARRSSTILARG